MENNDIRKAWETVVLPEDFESKNTLATYKGKYLSKSSIDASLSVITLAQEDDETNGKTTTSGLNIANTHEETARYSQPSTLSSCDYKLDKEIARGGMGVVFKGYQTSLKRDVAIKKILSKKSRESSKDKFIAESLVTAFLDHPNIVPVHELGESETGDILLTMKLVKGCSWRDLLHPKNDAHRKLAQKYDQEGHLRILLSVCNAIAFAHRWDIATGQKLISYPNYITTINALSFSNNGEKLYILSKNNLLLWSIMAAKLIDPDIQNHLKNLEKMSILPHVDIEKMAKKIFTFKVTDDLSIE